MTPEEIKHFITPRAVDVKTLRARTGCPIPAANRQLKGDRMCALLHLDVAEVEPIDAMREILLEMIHDQYGPRR